MRLYLVRHADAAPGDPDELRSLSAEGREQARSLAERLRADGVEPDAILTSPLRRARETAAELGRATGVTPEPDDRLRPGADAAAVREAVAGRGEHVIVIGHQPDCGHVAAALRGDGEEPAFSPAAMVVLDLD